MKSLLISFSIIFLVGCQNNNAQQQTVKRSNKTKIEQGLMTADPVEVPIQNGLARAYFASGCFWCVEAIYESVKGVKESISGYSGGHTLNPTYESSNTGKTGHAEAVEIIYDPTVVSFATLVDVYFGSQNVTQVNGQGPDIGSQYRSIIFYQNNEQKKIIEEKKAALAKKLNAKISLMTQIEIPTELPNILRNFTLSVLRTKPPNIIDHAVEYFTQLQQQQVALLNSQAAQAQAAAFAAINVLENKRTNFSVDNLRPSDKDSTSTVIRVVNGGTPYMADHLNAEQWNEYEEDLL